MGTVFEAIDDGLREWIGAQRLFFVATAPSGEDGFVNVSPKGAMDTFGVLGPHEVAYVDLFGSGIETVAHLKENGRIVLMFCAFEGPPRVLRLHGRGEVVEQGDERFAELRAAFDLPPEYETSMRSIVRVDVVRIADSCGFVVPKMAYEGERGQLFKTARAWIRQNGPDAIRDYCDVNNRESIDGLAGLEPLGSSATPKAHSHEGRKL
jgi:hypothetical protein